jgi:cytochrome P450
VSTTLAEPPQVCVDLSSQAFKQDPFPALADLQAAGPLVRVRVPLFGTVWLATTYEAASDLLRDHHRFVQSPTTAGNRGLGRIVRWLPRKLRPLTAQMLIVDEPDHRRLRRLVEQAFARQSVEALRPRLVALADAALDQFERRAARSPRGVDLVQHFARPFPLAVICELLGLPEEDRPQFERWASGLNAERTPIAIVSGLWGLSRLLDYVRREIKRQSQRPRGGLISDLIEAEEAGDRLSEDELVAMIFLLLAAGHHTTLHQIAGSVLILLDHPGELAELTADWSIAEPAVQELLRYLSFAEVSKPRYAREDTEFCGLPIRRGQMLFACLASANADPAEFPNPQRLDLRRSPNRHLAFGTGIHYCLGARLASVETEIALERLLTRFPRLRLAVPRSRIRFAPRFGTRGLVALPLAW